MSETGMMVTALGGATKAYTAYSAGKTNQGIDDFNANLERMQADQVLQKEGFDSARVGEKADILQGTQRAAFSGQGVLANAGTAQIVQDSSRATSQMDQTIMAINANRAAYGHDVAASNLEFQGDQARRQGNMAALGDLVEAGTQMELQHALKKGQVPEKENPIVDEPRVTPVNPYADGSVLGGSNNFQDNSSSHMSFT